MPFQFFFVFGVFFAFSRIFCFFCQNLKLVVDSSYRYSVELRHTSAIFLFFAVISFVFVKKFKPFISRITDRLLAQPAAYRRQLARVLRQSLRAYQARTCIAHWPQWSQRCCIFRPFSAPIRNDFGEQTASTCYLPSVFRLCVALPCSIVWYVGSGVLHGFTSVHGSPYHKGMMIHGIVNILHQ